MILATLLLALGAAPSPSSTETQAQAERIPVLVVTGANNHWWQWTSASLAEMLGESDRFAVEVTRTPAETLARPDLATRYRALVLDYNGPRWGEAAERGFLEAVRGGVGVVVVHAANNAFDGWKEYEELVALCWREGTGHGRFHAFDVEVSDREHPVTRSLADLEAHPDELYHRLVHMHATDYRVLATARSRAESGGTGADEPMVIVKQYGKGRVFHTPLGHVWPGAEGQKASHRDPGFRELLVRGTEWAATGEVSEPPMPPNRLTDAQREAGWEPLFDGRTTRGWRGYGGAGFPERGWVVEEGALRHVAGEGGGDLVSERAFADFELAFEWKVAPGGNSGVMYRVGDGRGATWETGPEYQLLDSARHGDGKSPLTSAGALYALYPATPGVERPAGEWNRSRILVVGNRVRHWLNGVEMVDAELWGEDWKERYGASKFAAMDAFAREPRGRIALQDHGDDVWFRSVHVRPLDFDPARARALFDGESLAGWRPFLPGGEDPAATWSVSPEGALVCLGRPAGYVRTERSYDNYVLRLRWRFRPDAPGNSGVLMRLVGEDKVWPRSIEAQLQSGAAGDFWNIDAFPMVADPARTDGRNTRRAATNERPLGEWNEYLITCRHGDVVLRVNGQVLNQARDCMEIAGPIALQSEGAEIHFEGIELMPLK